MEIDTLIHMANRIGAFFEAQPDREEALDGVAEHLRRYWEPRMRRSLLSHLDAGCPPGEKGESLSPFVREAIERQRVRLTPDSEPAAAA